MTCQVRALVVLPVRDLAVQVYKVFKAYSENTHLKVKKPLYLWQRIIVRHGNEHAFIM